MDKEESNFNIWGEISESELVLEAAKVKQIYEKQDEKRCYITTQKLSTFLFNKKYLIAMSSINKVMEY